MTHVSSSKIQITFSTLLELKHLLFISFKTVSDGLTSSAANLIVSQEAWPLGAQMT